MRDDTMKIREEKIKKKIIQKIETKKCNRTRVKPRSSDSSTTYIFVSCSCRFVLEAGNKIARILTGWLKDDNIKHL
jgi:hypothetical protein